MAYSSDNMVLPVAEGDGQRRLLIKFLLQLMYHLNHAIGTCKGAVVF